MCPFCHVYRKEPSGTELAASTGERAPEGNTDGFYVRSKVWDKPCPRCHHPSSVDLYVLPPVWTWASVLAALAMLVMIWARLPYSGGVVTLTPLYTALMLKFQARAKCRHCGAKLHKSLLGWA